MQTEKTSPFMMLSQDIISPACIMSRFLKCSQDSKQCVSPWSTVLYHMPSHVLSLSRTSSAHLQPLLSSAHCCLPSLSLPKVATFISRLNWCPFTGVQAHSGCISSTALFSYCCQCLSFLLNSESVRKRECIAHISYYRDWQRRVRKHRASFVGSTE